jgi:hypothetical protein
MSSIGRSIAQVRSNNFVTITSGGAAVPASQIAIRFPSANVQRVGTYFLLVNNITNLTSYVEAFAGDASGVSLGGDNGITVKDLGQDLIIGLQGGESKLITFRLVQISTTNTDFGNTAVGYVCVENRIPDTVNCDVRLARV